MISFKERQDLEEYETLTIAKILGKEVQKDSYLINFIDKYIKDENKYMFYPSIYETVTGGDIFNINKLRDELRKKYSVVDSYIPAHYQVYNRVLGHDYLKIPDQEYKKLLRKLKAYSAQGLYLIEQYPTLLYVLMRDGNSLRLSEERLVKQFIRIVKNKKNTHKYNPLLLNHFSYNPENPLSKSEETLIHAILKINKDVHQEAVDSKIKDLKQLFVEDFNEFYGQFVTFHYHRNGYFSFEGFTANFVYTGFHRMSNAQKQDFVNLLNIGYLETIYKPKTEELGLFKDLKNKVNNKLVKLNSKSNSTVLYNKIHEVLGKILTSHGDVVDLKPMTNSCNLDHLP